MGFVKFRRYFELMGVNRVDKFLRTKDIRMASDLTKCDDLESRHLIDQILMKTNLDEMRLSQVQLSLG